VRACEVDPPERVAAESVRRAGPRPEIAAVPSRAPSGGCPQGASAAARGRADATTLVGMRPAAPRARGGQRAAALVLLVVPALLALSTSRGPLRALPAGAAEGWSWPLDPTPAVLAGFDQPAGPFAPGHRGADLAARVGQPVRAASAGVVAFAGQVAGRGVVSVAHPDGHRTTYEPVAASVPAGRAVDGGEVVGTVTAAPGHCLPRTCLHWGLLLDGRYLDPLAMVSGVEVRLLPVWSGLPAPLPVPRAPTSPSARPGAPPPDRGPLLAGERGPG